MLQPAPDQAPCARHPGNAAAWICPRCGAFMCGQCERRTRPDAMPMCAACWELREQNVGPQKPVKVSTALQTAGLVVGIFAVLPLPAIQIAGFVISIMGMVRAKEPAQAAVRWRSVTGLCLSCVGLIVDLVVFTMVV